MMNLSNKIEAFRIWGLELTEENERKQFAFLRAYNENNWFTANSISLMLNSIIAEYLDKNKLKDWLISYSIPEVDPLLDIGLIVAGNVPLVGFHDIVCILLSGNNIKLKCSSKDEQLYRWAIELLSKNNPELSNRIEFVQQIKSVHALIATGSDLALNQFRHYFNSIPNLLRGHKNAVAVLDGNETTTDFRELAHDIFSYYGLGCRNVSKLYVPYGFSFESLLSVLDSTFPQIHDHHKYRNNFDYQLAIHMLQKQHFFQAQSCILVENNAIASPISVINYEYYTIKETLLSELKSRDEEIQCIVSKNKLNDLETFSFGQAQCPGLNNFADHKDSLKFLLNLNQ
ncbi:MAG TPA: acyl-CoA reductase [Saprospiraceae bacterium]|nr:acyl-CoA reductase [Saprospiraceae bacterium]